MPGRTFRVLLAGVLLVPLAWVGIVLFEKFHGRLILVPILVIWGLIAGADLAYAILSVSRSQRARVERTAVERTPLERTTVERTPDPTINRNR